MRHPRLELDHVAPPRRRRWLGVLILGVSLLACADLMLRYREALTELAVVRTETPVLSRTRAPRPALSRASVERDKSARAAVHQLALPWARLIAALEGAATPDIALLQLQPEAQSQVIRITAEARSTTAMFRYLRGLGQAPGLSQVHLLSHEVREDDSQRAVRFAAQASFRRMR